MFAMVRRARAGIVLWFSELFDIILPDSDLQRLVFWIHGGIIIVAFTLRWLMPDYSTPLFAVASALFLCSTQVVMKKRRY